MNNYPWTESGLNVLLAFEIMIKQLGGNEHAALTIKREQYQQPIKVNQPNYQNHALWHQSEIDYLIVNRNKNHIM
jgi:hypothetical protein